MPAFKKVRKLFIAMVVPRKAQWLDTWLRLHACDQNSSTGPSKKLDASKCRSVKRCAGRQLDGLQLLACHCMLHDALVVHKPLDDDQALPSLEDSWANADAAAAALRVLPDIWRVMNSKVSELGQIVTLVECLAALCHPSALQLLMQNTADAAGDAEADGRQVRAVPGR